MTLIKPRTNHQTERSGNPLTGRLATTCSRCEGFLVSSFCISPDQGAWEFQIPVWKCLQCGDVLDVTILKNRERSYRHAHN